MNLSIFYRLALVAAFAIVLAVSVAPPAFAQDSQVVIPWGDWLSSVLGYFREIIVTAIVAIIGYAMRWLPSAIRDILMAAQVEQLLSRAVDYGIAAVDGAVKGKTLSVPVANQVISEAASYAIENAPSLVAKLGDTLRPKIVARLAGMLPEEASASALGSSVHG